MTGGFRSRRGRGFDCREVSFRGPRGWHTRLPSRLRGGNTGTGSAR